MAGKPLDAGMPNDDAFALGYIARSAGHPGRAGVGDSIDRGLILAHTLRQYGYGIVRSPEGRTTDVPVTQIETPMMETWPPAMAYVILGDAEARRVLLDAGWREPVDAALTRRAGGDAIPAGMKPWHGGDCPPADWDETKPVGYADWSTGVLPKNTSNLAWSGEGLLRITAYTPKPPAGGDAGAVRWRERWYGSDPQRGSAIVDEAGNLIAYFGGDKETHRATTAAVAAHNAALAPRPGGGG